MDNVAFACLKDDVQRVEHELSGLIADKLAAYEKAVARRAAAGIPVIAFCGHGRAGKDAAAEWLSANYDIQYSGSISYAIAPLVARAQCQSVEQAFSERHANREYWFEFCNHLRRNDPALLVKITLADNDVIAGIRAAIELDAVTTAGVVDLSVWVTRTVAVDPTVEYDEDDCHLTIINKSSKLAYYKKLRSLARMLGLPTRKFCPKDCEAIDGKIQEVVRR